MILGLDISTSCTGWCLLDSSDCNLVDMGYIETSKEKIFFKKASAVKDELLRLSRVYDIERVFIEENLQAFRPGFSSAKTLMTLARFNGVISYICQRDLDVTPEFINVNIARKSIGLKINKKSSMTTKEQIFDWVNNRVNFSWPQKVLKSGPRKGKQVLEPGCYDAADAYVIALSACTNM